LADRHGSKSLTDTDVDESTVRALEDAEGRLRLLTTHTKGILFELDQHARFVRVWASDPRLLARPEHEILGRTVVEALGAELGQRHHDAALATVELGKAARYEYELDVAGGHRHFACESVAVPSPNGKGRHAVFWIRDITDQVELQRKLVEIERLASIGTLAAGVAHEVNNPLAYLMLNVEQLRKAFQRFGSDVSHEPDLAQMTDCVTMIHEGAQRVQRVVHDLQQFARLDEPVEPVSLRDALNLSLELTRGICESRAQLSTEWEEVPEVMGHQGRLVQVFTQLLTNAAEAIIEGSIEDNTIAVAVRRGSSDTVEVEVRDTGSGIPPCDAGRVFEPFFTTKEQGTGLGLPICQRIVNSFNGEIRLEPASPRGSVATVQLPVAE
jgi:two-component system, NtrC family, sensor kinase